MDRRRKVNKTQKVIEHLQTYGTITSLEAINLYGCTRLSAVIYNLRKRFNIVSEDCECVDKYGNKTKYAKYILKREV